ncbi:hypothetical protein QJS83_14495 [Bdellovibrio sp. 22V]|uniref:hypothetical protein n=1 Tax=Bdellovibrio sp. 22V TaxID=3044166 RepID=UPI00254314D9|nr:hypothetical protein [Bdellovibrio sp. 22V]WII71675.1 hypothetical protein QJS83_14495 [Bdellovibrio sp. 22V]
MKWVFLVTILFVLSTSSFASVKTPACMDRKDRMTFNENKVLVYRNMMEKKFTARAFVKGAIVRLMEDRQKHIHFEVDFDKDFSTSDDRIEVIYNTKFGEIPDFRAGDEIIACGDFVADPYSPHKGVIHWVHMNPKKGGPHEHGFLIINGVLTGQVNPKPVK